MDTSSNDLSRVAAMIAGGGLLDPAKVIANLDIRPGMRIADFGCGSGHFTLLLAQKVGNDGRITALDVQEAPLEAVRERAKASNLGNIETIHANLEAPGSSKLSDGSQDLVLAANILFQSPKKNEIIQEAKRVLKSGGKLVLVEWKKGSGGFGPPDNLRMDAPAITALVAGEGFAADRDIDVGQFHHVMLFTK